MTSLADRYAARTTSPVTKLLIGLAAVALAGLIVWFVWILWLNSTPKVTSDLGINYAVDDNHYQVTVTVTPSKGVAVSSIRCQADVEAKDSSTVGGPIWLTPTQTGANTWTIATTRRGVYLNWDGCDAPGQTGLR